MADLSLRENAEKTLTGLKMARSPYETEWRNIAHLAQPARSRFLAAANTQRKTRKASSKMIDPYAIRSFSTQANGMHSGLSSPARPWAKLKTTNPDLMNDHEVKVWLDIVMREIFALLNRSGFYDVAKAGYAELGLFGIEGSIMDEHWQEGAVCHSMTVGEYWTGLGSNNRPNVLYRQVPLTVSQIVEKFVAVSKRELDWSKVTHTVKNAWDNSNYYMEIDCYQAIEPNQEWRPDRIDFYGKPWRSIWWEGGQGNRSQLLRKAGYEEQPFWCPRWEPVAGDTYGNSPGINALPTLREIQLQAMRKREATDLLLYPEKIVPAALAGKLTGQARSTVAAGPAEVDKVTVPHKLDYQLLSLIGADIQQLHTDLDGMTFANLFNAITSMPGIQPRTVEEIASRNEEALTQLGPVIERVSLEKLQPAISRAYGLVSRGGMIPPVPEVLDGEPVEIEFISILAQMQRMVGLGQIERAVGFVGQTAGAFPDSLDWINPDTLIPEYIERSGASANILRSQADVDKLRAARAKQAASQQMLQAAGPAKDLVDAGALLATTDASNPNSMLSALGGLG